MSEEELEVFWEDILDKFSTYEGTIKEFCKLHQITGHQLYYRRKARERKEKQVFHPIKLNEAKPNSSSESEEPESTVSSKIRIEIGKAKIYIQNNDKASLLSLLEVIAKTC